VKTQSHPHRIEFDIVDGIKKIKSLTNLEKIIDQTGQGTRQA